MTANRQTKNFVFHTVCDMAEHIRILQNLCH